MLARQLGVNLFDRKVTIFYTAYHADFYGQNATPTTMNGRLLSGDFAV